MMIMVIITLANGIYQCLEDQELLLGHTQPLQAVDYQHALQKIVLVLSNPYWLHWLYWLPCQRIGLGHNGNSRPMIIKIITRHFFEKSDLHLGEGEVWGKVKAAQLGERPVDEGEGQHLPRFSISLIVRCTYFVVGFPNWHVSGCHFQEQVGKTMKELGALAALGIRERPNLAQKLVTHRHWYKNISRAMTLPL